MLNNVGRTICLTANSKRLIDSIAAKKQLRQYTIICALLKIANENYESYICQKTEKKQKYSMHTRTKIENIEFNILKKKFKTLECGVSHGLKFWHNDYLELLKADNHESVLANHEDMIRHKIEIENKTLKEVYILLNISISFSTFQGFCCRKHIGRIAK